MVFLLNMVDLSIVFCYSLPEGMLFDHLTGAPPATLQVLCTMIAMFGDSGYIREYQTWPYTRNMENISTDIWILEILKQLPWRLILNQILQLNYHETSFFDAETPCFSRKRTTRCFVVKAKSPSPVRTQKNLGLLLGLPGLVNIQKTMERSTIFNG